MTKGKIGIFLELFFEQRTGAFDLQRHLFRGERIAIMPETGRDPQGLVIIGKVQLIVNNPLIMGACLPFE